MSPQHTRSDWCGSDPEVALITFAACSGSPGTTDLAHALAASWPRRAVLLEADPDGGRLAARCGLPMRPGLVDLAGRVRGGHLDLADLARVSQRNDDGVDVVLAHPACEDTAGVLASSAERIGSALAVLAGVDTLVDAGRLRHASEALPIAQRSEQVVIVTGSRVEDVAALVHRGSLLTRLGPNIGLVVTAPGEHSATDTARAARLALIGERPGRSARRSTQRARRREDAWIRWLGGDLVARIDAASVTVPDTRP